MSVGENIHSLESSFQEDFKKFSLVILATESQNIRYHKLVFRDTYVNHLKCNFAIILSHRQLKFCLWGFRPLEFESTDKVFVSLFVQKLLLFEQQN